MFTYRSLCHWLGEGWRKVPEQSDLVTFLPSRATAVNATCTLHSAQWNSVGLLTITSRSVLNNMEIYSNYVIKWGNIMILRSMTDRHTLQVIKNHHLCHHLVQLQVIIFWFYFYTLQTFSARLLLFNIFFWYLCLASVFCFYLMKSLNRIFLWFLIGIPKLNIISFFYNFLKCLCIFL